MLNASQHRNMTNKIISVQECKEIIRKAVNIQANVTDIQYELNVIEDSFGYIADLARLTICLGKVVCCLIVWILGVKWRRKTVFFFKEDDARSNKKFIFFVKLIPLDSNGDIRRSDLTWMFEREAFMYSEMLLKFNGKWYEGSPAFKI